MHSRQPRLGDILDDYCPRERRVTNHAVVAMIGEEIKQTRCTTCDAEHEYKKAKVPAQRKKKHVATTLYEEVLTGMPGKLAHGVSPQAVSAPADTDEALDVAGPGGLPAPAPVAVAAAPAAPPDAAPDAHDATPDAHDESEGPVHRPLIRATLPRPEGQAKERPIPEFTARTVASRPGRFRPHGAHPAPHGGGHGPRFGRRGQGPGPFAAAGAPGHGNRAGHGDRQGARHRGGKRSK